MGLFHGSPARDISQTPSLRQCRLCLLTPPFVPFVNVNPPPGIPRVLSIPGQRARFCGSVCRGAVENDTPTGNSSATR